MQARTHLVIQKTVKISADQAPLAPHLADPLMPLSTSSATHTPHVLLPMAPQHMDAVMAVQAACYHAIAPESFAAMDAKRGGNSTARCNCN